MSPDEHIRYGIVPGVLPLRRLASRLRGHGMSKVVRLGLALVLGQLLLRTWALSGSWFYFDDLAFISRAMNSPMTPSYLTESYGGHLMPGGFGLIWLLTHWAVYDWWVWAVVLLVMQAAAGIGMLRLLVSMFGDRPAVLVMLAGYLSFVFTLSAGIWFAAGINQLPMQIALVFGLHAHLAYLRTRRWQHLAATLAWTAFGLVFYEKTLLLFGIYGLVALCWFSTGNTPERLQRLWNSYRVGIVAYSVVGVAYALIYVKYGLNFSPATAGNQSLTPIAWNLVAVALLPALIGGPLAWRPLDVGSFAEPSQLMMLVSWLAVATLVFYANQTRTVSRRAWSLIGFTLVANVILLGSARANIVGPDIALEYRYQTESAALFVLSAGLAFLPLRGALIRNALKPDVPRTYETPRIVLGVSSVIVIACLVSTTKYVHLWQERNPTKAYYAAVRKSLTESKKPVPLVDQGIPQTMLWAYRYPENTYSHVFRNFAKETSYPSASVDSLYVFNDKGRLSPVVVPATRKMLDTPGCGYSLARRRTQIPLNGPVTGGGWWIRMSYFSETRVALRIVAGAESHKVTLPAGLHNSFYTASGDFSSVVLSGYQAGTGLCVSDLVLGLPQAEG